MLNGEKPVDGQLVIEIEKPPVSLQAKSTRKNELKDFVVNKLKDARYFLSGDVKISIDWYVHEQKRYETSSSADIDNIIKPLLDSLCGPQGIIIDDNQVQSITCSWMDCYDYENEKLIIDVGFLPSDFIPKNGLFFVNVYGDLYMPLWESWDKKTQNQLVDSLKERLLLRHQMLLKSGIDYYDSRAKNMMPVQRVFHKGRLNGFTLKDKI